MSRDPTERYFPRGMTRRERAIFECGIALATIYHAFSGVPVGLDEESIRAVEKAIERAVLAQPFREAARVRIRPPRLDERRPFRYFTLRGRDIEAEVTVNYMGVRVKGLMRYEEELGYTLMRVVEISER